MLTTLDNQDSKMQTPVESEEDTEQIFLIGSAHRFSRCFLQALRNEFPHYHIEQCINTGSLSQYGGDACLRARLVIVHSDMCQTWDNAADLLRRQFPGQTIVLAYNSDAKSLQMLAEHGGYFDGHLPMDVRFDVWLSIIQLLVSGGEYVAPELLGHLGKSRNSEPTEGGQTIFAARDNHDNHNDEDVPWRNDEPFYGSNEPIYAFDREETEPGSLWGQVRHNGAGHSREHYRQQLEHNELTKLTKREIDVLKLAAEGQQNKNIAANLGLSEHTVKLHMHHVISKLSVSNRTEAAAIFINAGRVEQFNG